MNEDTLNMEIRKYLKKVGVTSQREIEHAVLKAIESGKLKGDETIEVKMTLDIPGLGLNYLIAGSIALE
jgi:ribosomal protein L1